MPALDPETLWLFAGVTIAVVIAVRLLQGVLRPVVVVAWRLIAGGAALWVVNLAGAVVGFHIGLNPVTALVTGFLGVPGLVALAGLRFLFP